MRISHWRAATAAAFCLAATTYHAASATPITCTSTLSLAPTGNGFELDSSLTAGVCVQTLDAVYGNFNLSDLPADGRTAFNLTNVGTPSVAYHGISFNENFVPGTVYTADYSVEILSGTNLFSQLDADFTQTNGTSNLVTTTTQGGSGSINWTKVGALGSGPDLITYSPGYSVLNVTNTLTDNGSISSLTNNAIENGAVPVPVPEPGSTWLVLSGVAILSVFSWMHGRRAQKI